MRAVRWRKSHSKLGSSTRDVQQVPVREEGWGKLNGPGVQDNIFSFFGDNWIIYIVALSVEGIGGLVSFSMQVPLGWWAKLKLPFSPGKLCAVQG